MFPDATCAIFSSCRFSLLSGKTNDCQRCLAAGRLKLECSLNRLVWPMMGSRSGNRQFPLFCCILLQEVSFYLSDVSVLCREWYYHTAVVDYPITSLLETKVRGFVFGPIWLRQGPFAIAPAPKRLITSRTHLRWDVLCVDSCKYSFITVCWHHNGIRLVHLLLKRP